MDTDLGLRSHSRIHFPAQKSPKTEPDRYMVGDRRFKTYATAVQYSDELKRKNITPNDIINL